MPVIHGPGFGVVRSVASAAMDRLDRKLGEVTTELQRIHREAREVEAMCQDLDDPNRDEYRCLTERQTVVRKALGEFVE